MVPTGNEDLLDKKVKDLIDKEIQKIGFEELCKSITNKVLEKVNEINEEHNEIKSMYNEIGEQLDILIADDEGSFVDSDKNGPDLSRSVKRTEVIVIDDKDYEEDRTVPLVNKSSTKSAGIFSTTESLTKSLGIVSTTESSAKTSGILSTTELATTSFSCTSEKKSISNNNANVSTSTTFSLPSKKPSKTPQSMSSSSKKLEYVISKLAASRGLSESKNTSCIGQYKDTSTIEPPELISSSTQSYEISSTIEETLTNDLLHKRGIKDIENNKSVENKENLDSVEIQKKKVEDIKEKENNHSNSTLENDTVKIWDNENEVTDSIDKNEPANIQVDWNKRNEPTNIQVELNKGNEPANIQVDWNKRNEPTNIQDEWNKGNEPANIQVDWNKRNEPTNIQDEWNKGNEPANIQDEGNEGNEPANIEVEGNEGIEPANIQDEWNKGNEPANIQDEGNEGNEPANIEVEGNEGIEPANIQDEGNEGNEPANIEVEGNEGIEPAKETVICSSIEEDNTSSQKDEQSTNVESNLPQNDEFSTDLDLNLPKETAQVSQDNCKENITTSTEDSSLSKNVAGFGDEPPITQESIELDNLKTHSQVFSSSNYQEEMAKSISSKTSNPVSENGKIAETIEMNILQTASQDLSYGGKSIDTSIEDAIPNNILAEWKDEFQMGYDQDGWDPLVSDKIEEKSSELGNKNGFDGIDTDVLLKDDTNDETNTDIEKPAVLSDESKKLRKRHIKEESISKLKISTSSIEQKKPKFNTSNLRKTNSIAKYTNKSVKKLTSNAAQSNVTTGKTVNKPIEKLTLYKSKDNTNEYIKVPQPKDTSIITLKAVQQPERKSEFSLSYGRDVFAKPTKSDIWYQAKLIKEAKTKKETRHLVRFLYGEKVEQKVLLKYIASCNHIHPDDVELGMRIVAGRPSDTVNATVQKKYNQNMNSTASITVMFAGTVAEIACKGNRYRYLVFFDDGYAQYLPLNRIFPVMTSSKEVWNDVSPDCRDFIKEYLEEYPYRPLVVTKVGCVMQTEWNGSWWNSRVVSIDSSLVKILFDIDQRSEWIYRGTPRLEPMYNHFVPDPSVKKKKKSKVHSKDFSYVDERITDPQFGISKYSLKDPQGKAQIAEWGRPLRNNQMIYNRCVDDGTKIVSPKVVSPAQSPSPSPSTAQSRSEKTRRQKHLKRSSSVTSTSSESSKASMEGFGASGKKRIKVECTAPRSPPPIPIDKFQPTITPDVMSPASEEFTQQDVLGALSALRTSPHSCDDTAVDTANNESDDKCAREDVKRCLSPVSDTDNREGCVKSPSSKHPSPKAKSPKPKPSSPKGFVTSAELLNARESQIESRLVPHSCNETCIADRRDFLEEHRLGKTNYLAIPFFLGWKRESAKKLSSYHRDIYYRTPCKKRLRNLAEITKYLLQTNCTNVCIDMFCFHAKVSCRNSVMLKLKTPKVFIEDLSDGRETCPVVCINEIDDEHPPQVAYITSRNKAEDVYINIDPGFLVCCDCTDNCQDKSKCQCAQLTVETSNAIDGVLDQDAGYQYRRLKECITTGIYECNQNCSCHYSTCYNRVVQNGIQLRLQVFMTDGKGWGVRCLDDIPKGTFICTYAGQILNEQTANKEGMDYGDEYLAEMDHIEVVEKAKDGYESDVPELKDKSYDDSDCDSYTESESSESVINISSDSSIMTSSSGEEDIEPLPKKPIHTADTMKKVAVILEISKNQSKSAKIIMQPTRTTAAATVTISKISNISSATASKKTSLSTSKTPTTTSVTSNEATISSTISKTSMMSLKESTIKLSIPKATTATTTMSNAVSKARAMSTNMSKTTAAMIITSNVTTTSTKSKEATVSSTISKTSTATSIVSTKESTATSTISNTSTVTLITTSNTTIPLTKLSTAISSNISTETLTTSKTSTTLLTSSKEETSKLLSKESTESSSVTSKTAITTSIEVSKPTTSAVTNAPQGDKKPGGDGVVRLAKKSTCQLANKSIDTSKIRSDETKKTLSTRAMYGGDKQMYIIDAKSFGNVGRFINHSCSPNLFVQNVMVDTHDLRFPWVAFFSQQNISAYTELTWDYSYEIGSVPGKELFCKCGSKSCKGRLL